MENWVVARILIVESFERSAAAQEGVELRQNRHGVVVGWSRTWCYSIEETGVDEFLEEKLDVAQLRVFDAQRL